MSKVSGILPLQVKVKPLPGPIETASFTHSNHQFDIMNMDNGTWDTAFSAENIDASLAGASHSCFISPINVLMNVNGSSLLVKSM